MNEFDESSKEALKKRWWEYLKRGFKYVNEEGLGWLQ